jgi:hypothetical protein
MIYISTTGLKTLILDVAADKFTPDDGVYNL